MVTTGDVSGTTLHDRCGDGLASFQRETGTVHNRSERSSTSDELASEEVDVFITITTGQATPDQAQLVNEFLAGFLPRLEQQTQALAAYHFNRLEKGEGVTLIIWPSREAVQEYRGSDERGGGLRATPGATSNSRGLRAELSASSPLEEVAASGPAGTGHYHRDGAVADTPKATASQEGAVRAIVPLSGSTPAT